MSSAALACSHTHSSSHCQKSEPISSLLHLMQLVSGVALALFAAKTSFDLFVPFFVAGIALGLYQVFSGSVKEAPRGGSSCSGDLLQQVTGVRLPAEILFCVNLAITWCHIDHHPEIFVPIIGLWMGAWGGQLMGKAICWLRPQDA